MRTPLSYLVRFGEGLPHFIPDGTLVKGTEPTIYYIDEQTRRPIKDLDTFRFLKFTENEVNEVVEIPDPELFKYKMGEWIDKEVFSKNINNILIKSPEWPEIYITQNGCKRWIVNETTYRFYGYQDEKNVYLPQHIIDAIKNGPPLSSEMEGGMLLPIGIVLKEKDQHFLVMNNCLHEIKSPHYLRKLRLAVDQAIEIPANFLQCSCMGKGVG